MDLSAYGMSSDWFGPLFFGIALAAVGFSLVNWRCPSCNVYLGRGISPRFCSKCGIELR